MNEILDFYQEQAPTRVTAVRGLADLQAHALDEFKRQGFPTRHHEEWKYTVLDAFLKQPFSQSTSPVNATLPTPSDLPVARQITLHNGVITGLDTFRHSLPKGVILCSLADALSEQADLIEPYLGKILHQEHAFHFLNTAMIQYGIFLYVPAGVCIEEPIGLIHYQDKPCEAIHLRHLIIAEAKSQVTLVEEYRGEEGCPYLTNTVTEIAIKAGANVSHYAIQRQSKSAFHMGHVSVNQAACSEFSSHSLSLGGQLVRSDLSLYLQEKQAHCLMNGLYVPSEGQHVDHHTTVHHLAPSCRSDQDYKGILTGHSRAVFNGKVIVAKDAQHTDAKQQNKNLLLSKHAEIDTKPQLEIFANDVLCSHGATVGQLDEEALFYLATRGIDRVEASHYLIHAFAHDNLRLIPNRVLANWMGSLVSQQVG